MDCKLCKKGFMTEQINLEGTKDDFSDCIVTKLYDVYYSFCSNVFCKESKTRRELKSQKVWDKKTREYR